LLEDLFFENSFITDALSPGIGAHINCHMGLNNIDIGSGTTDNAGLHRSRDPAVGSFSSRYNYTKVALKDIVPGEELFVSYGGELLKLLISESRACQIFFTFIHLFLFPCRGSLHIYNHTVQRTGSGNVQRLLVTFPSRMISSDPIA